MARHALRAFGGPVLVQSGPVTPVTLPPANITLYVRKGNITLYERKGEK